MPQQDLSHSIVVFNVEAASRRQLPNMIDSKPKCNEKDVVD